MCYVNIMRMNARDYIIKNKGNIDNTIDILKNNNYYITYKYKLGDERIDKR